MASVLVVDDEADIRELVRMNLELDGHRVRSAANGLEALEFVREDVPDVILLDVMMPGMDGWEVLGRLKAERTEAAAVPVLMLTARADDMDRIRGGIEGAIRYITKPFSVSDLRDEVRRAVEGEPEAVKRRRAQHTALEALARLEKGEPYGSVPAPRPRLSRLESIPDRPLPGPEAPKLSAAQVRTLSPKQRDLLRMVGSTPTVRLAAQKLEVSRSNVYASLRRIARKLDVKSVPELVTLARRGGVPDTD